MLFIVTFNILFQQHRVYLTYYVRLPQNDIMICAVNLQKMSEKVIADNTLNHDKSKPHSCW